jgi:hypothetical protein
MTPGEDGDDDDDDGPIEEVAAEAALRRPDATIMRRFRFSVPFNVTAREWRSTIRNEPIVYRVRVWHADGSGPLPIKRAGGDDPHGILDIGESQHGRGRLERFAKVALGEKLLSHRAGVEYSTTWGYDFATVFPSAQLRIDVLKVSSKELAEAIEMDLLERYRWDHKDRPPLNSSAGKYRKVFAWLMSMQREPRDSDGWLNLDGLIDDLIAP